MRVLTLPFLCLWCGVSMWCADAPTLRSSDVVSAADYHGGGVVPNEVVVLFAADAGPGEMVSWALDTKHTGPYSLNSLGDTRVYFDDIAAPMVYAVHGKICAIVPHELTGRSSTSVTVEYQGRRSQAVTLPVINAAPALFTLDSSGAGQAAMLNETGCCNSVRNPAVRGRQAALYATGDGSLLVGMKHEGPDHDPVAVKVTVGGVPAEVTWQGNTGVLQVNFRVPLTAPVGDGVPLVLTVGGISSSTAVTMSVRSEKQQVLVIESQLAARRWLNQILVGAGFDVLAAHDEDEATELSAKNSIDLVISEVGGRMETMDALRKSHPLMKTLVLSSTANADELRAADLLGAQAVVSRPLSARTVLDRVGVLLQRRPAVY